MPRNRRARAVARVRFYGNLSQPQIAERIGRSQMHVSCSLRHALGFLQRHLES
ncbi:sigma factor-like helix-turn-helix DNA-binding protein [Dactylosporangium sp. CA-139066]|uniref:sigma factor-like helix-turn-helix DNA-binding protein n=1 Tax=Dactylosporangium sp. CA-139066 TaxID=3239930 RepID=UPI003D8CD79F